MINKQNKHGPRDGLSQGIRASRGSPLRAGNSPPLHRRHALANYPYVLIIKPPGSRSGTLKKWSRYGIAYGLPVKSQIGWPARISPYTTLQSTASRKRNSGESFVGIGKGRGMFCWE